MKYDIEGRIMEIGAIAPSNVLPAKTGIVVDPGPSSGMGLFFLPTDEVVAKSLAERGFLFQKTRITIDFTVVK